MRLWGGMSKVGGWFRWGRSSEDTASTSRLLVSFYVQDKSMPRRGLSRASRRILLTTSIWSVIVLVLAFFITYTVLLVLVDRPFRKDSHGGKLSDGAGLARPKLRFHGKGFGLQNRTSIRLASVDQRRRFWSPKLLNDVGSDLPECKRGSLFVVIITSSPDHFDHRTEIRKTWCNSTHFTSDDSTWQCVFLIGQTGDNSISSRLKQEGQTHGDILRGSYLDSYRNLTLKVMHGLAWLSTECETPYMLKTDDDCFVNTLLLWQFLLHSNTQTSDLYAGNMVVRTDKRAVIRDPKEKWSVSKDDFLPEYYPMYASGSGYAISYDVVKKAVEESEFIKPIPNEDAYIGIVMDRLRVKPTLSGRFTLSSAGLRVCNYKYVFVAHGVSPSMHQDMQKKMLLAQSECEKEEEVRTWY